MYAFSLVACGWRLCRISWWEGDIACVGCGNTAGGDAGDPESIWRISLAVVGVEWVEEERVWKDLGDVVAKG